jgi:hypothetical protein
VPGLYVRHGNMKKWIKNSILFGCLPILILLGCAAFLLFFKVAMDFPAKKDAYNTLKTYTGITRNKGKVYARSTGWEDTQTYIRFEASKMEIQQLINELNLKETNAMSGDASFYWWNSSKCGSCQVFHENEGADWTWLLYDHSESIAYYFNSTF